MYLDEILCKSMAQELPLSFTEHLRLIPHWESISKELRGLQSWEHKSICREHTAWSCNCPSGVCRRHNSHAPTEHEKGTVSSPCCLYEESILFFKTFKAAQVKQGWTKAMASPDKQVGKVLTWAFVHLFLATVGYHLKVQYINYVSITTATLWLLKPHSSLFFPSENLPGNPFFRNKTPPLIQNQNQLTPWLPDKLLAYSFSGPTLCLQNRKWGKFLVPLEKAIIQELEFLWELLWKVQRAKLSVSRDTQRWKTRHHRAAIRMIFSTGLRNSPQGDIPQPEQQN